MEVSCNAIIFKTCISRTDMGWNSSKTFNYDIPSDYTGECWAISAHPNGTNTIENGRHQGKTLEEVWNEDKALLVFQVMLNFHC